MKLGDCFYSAGEYITNHCLFDPEKRKTMRLVHGLPTMTVPPNIKHVHAWIEVDGTVICTETDTRCPQDLYYAVGKIDPDECFVYTYDDVKDMIAEFDHWGPWELETPPEEAEYREEHCG